MTNIAAINIDDFEKAQKIINKQPKAVIDYMARILNGEEFEYRLESKLIVDNPHDKEVLDQYIKAYQLIYKQFRKDRRTDLNKFKSSEGNEWLKQMPTAVCNTARSYAICNKEANSNEFAFGLQMIRGDKRIRIPKLGAFSTEQRLVMPVGRVPSVGYVNKNTDGTYTIRISTKKARKEDA